MSKITLRFAALSASVLAFAIPTLSQAGTIFLARDTVVPVIIENDLTMRGAREGDRFTAHVDGDRDLPFRTRLIGRVARVEQDHGDRHAFLDLEFTDVILPDGSRHPIDAVPVSLDRRYVDRRSDGRMVVKEDARKKEGYVLGGTVGGFILGSIIHKQAEATVLGTLAGIIAAETDRRNDGNTVLQKGQRIGALIERDSTFETYDRRGRRDRGYDENDDRYDRRRDENSRRDRSRDDLPPRDREIVLAYDNKDLTFSRDARPYREGESVMIPLEETVKQLGFTFERGRTNAIYIEGEDSSLRLEQDSTEARLNGRRVTLATSVIEKDGVLYAPIEILASIAPGKILVNGNRITPRTF
ncbi:stalk domain-containing protein [Fimbriimonas ginsengisoli]|uniref:Copper amine oxidase-like N-terminal domain-containing protein n=1 Tax=Fimbriimonas ginsengisoli Gsoil 348 TaxID=661478 RepID=A0A068NQE2_FIMGI|nr:stalk domain-containing protein [Fimbriimonas ginsengisoli]AIE85788.1 hypothetical protein OP10G_2420 [Fimbriimonas ginsengisoli Gsoil 348]